MKIVSIVIALLLVGVPTYAAEEQVSANELYHALDWYMHQYIDAQKLHGKLNMYYKTHNNTLSYKQQYYAGLFIDVSFKELCDVSDWIFDYYEQVQVAEMFDDQEDLDEIAQEIGKIQQNLNNAQDYMKRIIFVLRGM